MTDHRYGTYLRILLESQLMYIVMAFYTSQPARRRGWLAVAGTDI